MCKFCSKIAELDFFPDIRTDVSANSLVRFPSSRRHMTNSGLRKLSISSSRTRNVRASNHLLRPLVFKIDT